MRFMNIVVGCVVCEEYEVVGIVVQCDRSVNEVV